MNCVLIGFGGIGSRLSALGKISDFNRYIIFDNDTYEESNVGRQSTSNLTGRKKAEVAKEVYSVITPHECQVEANPIKLTSVNLPSLEEETIVFCTVDNPAGRIAVHEWARSANNVRRPDIVVYGMNELENGEAVLDIPAIPWWPDPSKAYPNSFYEGQDATNQPHCSNLQNEGGVVAEQIATINATIAGDMLHLFEAARHMQRNPQWITDPSLEVPLPWAHVTTALMKKTRRIYAGGSDV
jgi:molybdopterin/thiamine biosynthesis adenylyltransferase